MEQKSRELNKKQFIKYSKEAYCPSCNKLESVRLSDLQELLEENTTYMLCTACGARWEEQYILHKVIVNKEGDTDEGS